MKTFRAIVVCVCALLLLLLAGCACKHEFGEWEIVEKASCTDTGMEQRICTKCGESETQSVPTVSHSYGGWKTVVKADCINTGEECRECKNCGVSETRTVSKTNHTYDAGKETSKATCTKGGTKVYTCKVCNAKKTTDIPALGHDANADLLCTRCGEQCPLDSIMTAQDRIDSEKVYWRSGVWVDHVDSKKQFEISFTLQDKEKTEYLRVPLYIDVKIVNDNGEELYSATRVVRKSDYNGSEATLVVEDSQITGGTIESGDFEITIYSPGYFWYDAVTNHVYSDLPLKPITIILPALPATIHDYNYDKSISTSVKITGITYEIEHVDTVYFYFTGEKTYDEEGNNYSQSAKVGWKLYDAEGYIIDSGTFYSPGLKVGEKFRNEKTSSYDKIVPGGTYTLEIVNVD